MRLTSLICGLTLAAALAATARAEDLTAGQRLYGQVCATCHGADLQGQADWKYGLADGTRPAPPHDATGHTWHHGDGMLFAYTKFGGQVFAERNGITGFKSAMPGFGAQLTDQEIRDVLGYIRSTWPKEVQLVQEERTANE